MTSIDVAQATSLSQAIALLNSPGTRALPLGGGTDLLVMMRSQGAWFDRLVDVTRVPELLTVTEDAGEFRIGAAVTFAQAAANPLLAAAVPLLVQACLSVGSPQIRNVGTLGGNIANAAACADTLPPLVALGATARIAGPDGERTAPVGDLVVAPHHTALRAGELIVSFNFPRPPAGAASAFVKLGRRNAQAIARLSIAALGRIDADGRIDFMRLAPGAAIPASARMLAAAGACVAEAMIARTGRRWSTEYKEVAIQGLVELALSRVFGIAPVREEPV
jgi:CO/xanthine dehydrogenase FAD-binding subunit